jgi:hypothetical protein
MKLVVILPAGTLDTAHQPEQSGADRGRRAQGDEQAVHEQRIAPVAAQIETLPGFP